MPSKNFLAYQDRDLPGSRQFSQRPSTGNGNAVVRLGHTENHDMQEAKSQIAGLKQRVGCIDGIIKGYNQRLKDCLNHSSAAKGINVEANNAALRAHKLAEDAHSVSAAEHIRLSDFKRSQEKYDDDVWRQVKDLKGQVVANREALLDLKREVSNNSGVAAPASMSDSAMLLDLTHEVDLLKQQNAEMQDGSAAFTSLLKDWLKSKEAGTGQPLEEGEWNALAEPPPSNLLIKVVMGGILKLNRDHQELEKTLKTDMELMKVELQRLTATHRQGTHQQGPVGRSKNEDLSMQLNQLQTRMTSTQKMFTKHIDLQITEKASLFSKVEAYTSLVRQYVKKQGGVGLTEQEDERLKNERDQIYQWTCRFLNLLGTGPSAFDSAKMDKYDHNIMTMEQMISEESGQMNEAEKTSLLNIVGSIKRVAELTRETLDSIPTDQNSVGFPSHWERNSGLQITGASQAGPIRTIGQQDVVPVAAGIAGTEQSESLRTFAEYDLVPVVSKKRALSFDDSGNRSGGEVKPAISTNGLAYYRSDDGVDRADRSKGAAAGRTDRYGAGVGKADYYCGGGVSSSSHWSPSHKRRRRSGLGPGLPY